MESLGIHGRRARKLSKLSTDARTNQSIHHDGQHGIRSSFRVRGSTESRRHKIVAKGEAASPAQVSLSAFSMVGLKLSCRQLRVQT